jgi:hypothetical protein
MNKENIRASLVDELKDQKIFWSYSDPDPMHLSDEWLIEKILLHSDLESIYKLFEIYSENRIKQIWKDRLLPDGSMHSLNLLYALILFRIKDPDGYIQTNTE